MALTDPDGSTLGRSNGALDPREVFAGNGRGGAKAEGVERVGRAEGAALGSHIQQQRSEPLAVWADCDGLLGEFPQGVDPNLARPDGAPWARSLPVPSDSARQPDGPKSADPSQSRPSGVEIAPPTRQKSEAEMDQALAEGLRFKLMPHLVGLKKVMDEAQAHGMSINYNLGLGPSGKHVIGPIQVVKHL